MNSIIDKIEYMRPDSVHERIANFPAAFVPVGPIEWHGPHNAVGLDAINAASIAERLSTETGGMLFPTLFLGTECERDAEFLRLLCFDKSERMIGMDFPDTSLNSIYIDEKLFHDVMYSYIEGVLAMGFRVAVLINGHGAVGQVRALDSVCRELSRTDASVLNFLALMPVPGYSCIPGHATTLETSILMSVAPDAVKLSALPDKSESPRLSSRKYGIMDPLEQYNGTADYVRDDPRDACSELGKAHADAVVEHIKKRVIAEIDRLNEK